MPTPRDTLLAKAAEVVCDLSAGQAEALAYDIAIATEPEPLRKLAGLASPKSVKELGQLWMQGGALDGPALAAAITCAAQAVKTASSYEKVELLYTGPDSDALRRNVRGLLEVIRGARERLWVVSYVFVGVNEVLHVLQERAQAGVRVNVLIDHRVENAEQAFQRLATAAPGCQPYTWPDEQRVIAPGQYANLHAKCAVADGRQAFVANLTGWAMDHNLEVGYLVTGGDTPSALHRHLDDLVTDGALTPPF